MLDVMRGMPASISASPLRERQRAGFNLPSAAVHSVMHASASNILTLTVTITGMYIAWLLGSLHTRVLVTVVIVSSQFLPAFVRADLAKG